MAGIAYLETSALMRVCIEGDEPLRRRLSKLESRVDRMPVEDDIVERCRHAFPVEPIRSLDAIHVASAELWSQRVGAITVFSIDPRVRDNAVALGLPVHPPVEPE